MFMIKMIATELWSRAVNPEAFAAEQEIASAIVQLRNSSDRQLADMGFARDDIENALRNGRAQNDPGNDRHAA